MMWIQNFLSSNFRFDEAEANLAFKFRILNTIMLIAAVFAALFALMHDLRVNDIGDIHAKVDYFYSVSSVVLILLLRRSRRYFTLTATLFLGVSLLTFISALIFVTGDEFRIVWFYFAIYVAYVLLGARAGMLMTAASLAAIIVCSLSFDLQLSQTALFTSVLGLLVASLLSRTYTVQMSHYEALLQKKNAALMDSVKELDTALEQANEASRAKSLFLANMSHEIRTPMNGVLGMVQVMHTTAMDAEQKHYIETIERSSKHLLALIDELLDLSKIESGTLELVIKPFDTFQWVLDIQVVAESLFEERRVAFVTEVNDELPAWLKGDASRLMSVVVNLISNAAKFTHEGEVTLGVKGHYNDNSHYMLRVAVEDTGVGIPESKLPTIFDNFQQVAPERITNKGVGLGLAISKRLIDAMGGNLTVSSIVGKGSRFELAVELPVVSVDKTPLDEGSRVTVQSNLSVLLVDDDAISRLAVSTLLKKRGHSVVEVENGENALQQVAAYHFDVVLMDVHMPVMDGVTATRSIRASDSAEVRQLPVIGMTASVMNDEQASYLQAGMNAVVEKPIVLERLMAEIWGVLHERHQPEL